MILFRIAEWLAENKISEDKKYGKMFSNKFVWFFGDNRNTTDFQLYVEIL